MDFAIMSSFRHVCGLYFIFSSYLSSFFTAGIFARQTGLSERLVSPQQWCRKSSIYGWVFDKSDASRGKINQARRDTSSCQPVARVITC